jgi:arsenite methyltransferase
VRTRFAGWPENDVAEALALLGEWRDRVLDGALLGSGDAVVDIGSGTGLLTLGAVDRVGTDGDVLAVDVSVDALEALRAHATAANISYLVGSAEVLPMTDESVDALVARSVLIYVEDKAEGLREAFRVLRRGGRMSVFEPINSRNLRLADAVDFSPLGDLGDRVRVWNEALYAEDDPMVNFHEHDLTALFRAAGFDDVALELGVTEQEIPGDRYLTQVGAPGRPTTLERWQATFAPEDVERLAAFIAERTIPTRVQHAFVTARKS